MGVVALYVCLRFLLFLTIASFAVLVFAVISYLVFHFICRARLLPFIPEIKSNSLLMGYTIPFFPLASGGKGHQLLRDIAETDAASSGAAQFFFSQKHIVLIFDSKMAKKALKSLPKIPFGDPKLVQKFGNSTFNSTGAESEFRRRIFRPAFSASSLRQHEATIRGLVEKVG